MQLSINGHNAAFHIDDGFDEFTKSKSRHFTELIEANTIPDDFHAGILAGHAECAVRVAELHHRPI